MGQEVALGSQAAEFVVALSNQTEQMSNRQLEQAISIVQGSGMLCRYAVHAIVREFGGQSATVAQRDKLRLLCVNSLEIEMDTAYQMARHVDMEIELFGPITADPERMKQSISQASAIQLRRLPDTQTRRDVYAQVRRFVETAGASPRFTTNITHAVNRRLRAIETAEREEEKAAHEARDEMDAAESAAESQESVCEDGEGEGDSKAEAPQVSHVANARWMRQLAFACEILQKPGTIPTRSKIGCATELRRIADYIEKM